MPDSTGQVRRKILRSGVMIVQSVTPGGRHRKEEHAPMEACFTKRPLERVAMDILGPLPETPRGHRYILVRGDYFTKWKEAFPLRDMKAISIARVLVNEFICRLGYLTIFIYIYIYTDQGKNFESKLVNDVCILLGVRKTRTSSYQPQSDGLVERFNKALLEMLSKTVLEKERDWDLFLPSLLFAYRTSAHETPGTTPWISANVRP